MKKILLIITMCLMALTLNAQQYVDLGLPSGTLWKDVNEAEMLSFDAAFLTYGESLPSKAQFDELVEKCTWTWNRNGYKVTGSNGNSIFLPAAGFRDCNGDLQNGQNHGNYWSSTTAELGRSWSCYFTSTIFGMGSAERCSWRAVRLVKSK